MVTAVISRSRQGSQKVTHKRSSRQQSATVHMRSCSGHARAGRALATRVAIPRGGKGVNAYRLTSLTAVLR
eukprot:7381238-Prymnesium_polylepis.2